MHPDADWRASIDVVDAILIDDYQSGFPVEPNPFERVAHEIRAALGRANGGVEAVSQASSNAATIDDLDAEITLDTETTLDAEAQLDAETTVDAETVLKRVRQLREQGVFRRFGAVLNPPVIGSSTLAAVQAPEDRFDEIAAIINGYRQVNHNYRRDHPWNQWFVVTAGSRERRDAILAEIEAKTGCSVLHLPMLTDYYIDLEFPVVNDDRFARESLTETQVSATRISEDAREDLTPLEADLLLAIQDGFPLTATPYADIAEEIGAERDAVIEAVKRLLADGCIKRVGCIVNHVVTGFTNNCMVVWDVPDKELDARGEAVGSLPYVTLCYHRPRRPAQDWNYSLFTMIHGRDADAVDAKIDELAAEYLPYPHERLYSTETLKQTGAQYESLVAAEE